VRAAAIGSWVDAVSQELEAATNTAELADQLAEWAWIEWQREDLDRARALLAVSAELSGNGNGNESGNAGDEGKRALARARVEAVFGPFLESLENEALDKTGSE